MAANAWHFLCIRWVTFFSLHLFSSLILFSADLVSAFNHFVRCFSSVHFKDMRAASIYRVLCLLAALFCSRGLGAGYSNASTTGQSQPPAGITSSSFTAAVRSSASVREDAYEGCVVKLNQVISWDWSPIPNFSTNSATVPTNSAGTHTTTVQFVTGAYQRNGSWVPLTGTSTLYVASSRLSDIILTCSVVPFRLGLVTCLLYIMCTQPAGAVLVRRTA